MTLAGRIREAFRGLSLNGKKPVAYAQVFEALGATTRLEKRKIRSAVRDFLKRGELVRTDRGVYEYREHAPRRISTPLYKKMWRLIRMKERFRPLEIVQLTGADRTHVYKYVRFLAELGFVTRHGRAGQEHVYRLTTAGRERVETPYPSREYRDRWRETRDAAWRAVRIIAEGNLSVAGVREKALAEVELVARALREAGGASCVSR